MKRHQYLSANAATVVLAFLLWQAQVKAETGAERQAKSERKSERERDEERAANVTKGQQRLVRARSAMRRRALMYEPAIAAAAAKYKVDPRALWTIAYLETRFRSSQTSPKGARGLMQFMPGTAARFNLKNSYDGLQSIDAAAQYLAVLTRQFGGRLDLALASYNAGETAVDCYLKGRTVRLRNGKTINRRGIRTGGVPPYRETQAYVRRGMLIFNRVSSAGIFSQNLIANVRELSLPSLNATALEVALVNRDLIDLGGSPAVLYRTANASPATIAASLKRSQEVEQGFQTVFFDVHSGARYLVQSGRIVQPIESETASENDAPKEVTRSVYFGGRE